MPRSRYIKIICCRYTLDKIEGAIKKGQSNETGNIDNKTKHSEMDSRYLSLHIFLIVVKRRGLSGHIYEILSPVFIMVNHINKWPHPSGVDVHIIKTKVNISQTKITVAKFVYHGYVL